MLHLSYLSAAAAGLFKNGRIKEIGNLTDEDTFWGAAPPTAPGTKPA
jgi:hypothetical protein